MRFVNGKVESIVEMLFTSIISISHIIIIIIIIILRFPSMSQQG